MRGRFGADADELTSRQSSWRTRAPARTGRRITSETSEKGRRPKGSRQCLNNTARSPLDRSRRGGGAPKAWRPWALPNTGIRVLVKKRPPCGTADGHRTPRPSHHAVRS
ncbi:hypothetical protein SSOG_00253 [Streptomyces himastatinicus ATCC 53653]|uniref:Uncharacterized protein n=1 Tax=Streptomyces himastatinicus ATCC 53653 TaxID=457427 RepID=D9W807_9ACTN|nr:hypothetical protein SSOG_00253 [Streptomyces himastatinicus ATCC 53653]